MSDQDNVIYVHQENMLRMVSSQILKDSDYKVFLHLMATMDIRNRVYETQGNLASQLDRSRRFICTSLRRLHDDGRIRYEGGVIFLNPEIAWKGSPEDRDELILEQLEATLTEWYGSEATELTL